MKIMHLNTNQKLITEIFSDIISNLPINNELKLNKYYL